MNCTVAPFLVRPLIALAVIASTFDFPIARAAAADTRVRIAELTGYGLFEDGDTRSYLVDHTTTPTVTPGARIGIEYVVHAANVDRPIRVEGKIIFPGDGITHPDGTIVQQAVVQLTIQSGRKSVFDYGLNEAWQQVPGEGQFVVLQGDVVLARKTLFLAESGTEL